MRHETGLHFVHDVDMAARRSATLARGPQVARIHEANEVGALAVGPCIRTNRVRGGRPDPRIPGRDVRQCLIRRAGASAMAVRAPESHCRRRVHRFDLNVTLRGLTALALGFHRLHRLRAQTLRSGRHQAHKYQHNGSKHQNTALTFTNPEYSTRPV